MRPLFSYLIPYDTNQLSKERIGCNNDGGYVIPIEALQEIQAVVVFGVNNEDSFEQGLTKYLDPKKVPFFLCDPYVEYTKQNKFSFLRLGLSDTTKEIKVSRPIFCNLTKAIRYNCCFTSWPIFKKKYKLENKTILLKMDIEGAEWESLACLVDSDLENIDCLIIEFHELNSTEKLAEKEKVLSLLQKYFTLVHCHQNNCGSYFVDGCYFYPDVLECTFVSKSFLEKYKINLVKRQTKYPSEIDQPNSKEMNDFPIYWWVDDILLLGKT
jgi:hypothetical protein